MPSLFECPYCGKAKLSENGTGSDVACCGERGHAVLVTMSHFASKEDYEAAMNGAEE